MKKYFENSNPDEKNPNYLQIGGKMRNLQIKGTKFLIKDNEKALSQFYYNSRSNDFSWKCIIAKTDKADSHRLWFDVDRTISTKEEIKNILTNIKMILLKNLIQPETRSLVTMNIGENYNKHIKYPDIYVNNTIRKALVEKINGTFGDKYVDNKANTGLRLESCNKWCKDTKKFILNSRYVKENKTDLTIEELIGEYNILKKGKLIRVKKGLIKEVEKIQKNACSKKINMENVPEWVKLQLEQINNDHRFKNKVHDVSSIRDNLYILNLKQGSFQCPFIKKIHSSNRNKIYLYEDHKKSYLGCHKCLDKKEYLNLKYNKCLIVDDVIDLNNNNKFEEFFNNNKTEINKIILQQGELQYAGLCEKFYKDDIVCTKPDKEIFFLWDYNVQLWKQDIKGCKTKIKISYFLCNMVDELKKECDIQINNNTDRIEYDKLKDKKKLLEKIFKNVASHRSMVNIMKTFTTMVYNDNFEKNLNKNRKILSIKDGVIDLQYGTFRKRTRDDMLSYRLEREYKKPDLKNLGYLGKFLNDSFKDKGTEKKILIEWLQKFLGYCLTGEVKEQIFCIWLGKRGGNGKSLLCSLMAEVMEELYTNLPVSDITKGGRHDSEKKLMGKCIDKRMGVFEEPDQQDRLKESIIKVLCGFTDSAIVNAKKLYKDPVDVYMYITTILNTNYQINADPNDNAFWRRVQVVPFDRFLRSTEDDDYNEKDKLCGIRYDNLLIKIQKEDLFFYWIVEGARKYYESGIKKTPDCMKIAKIESKEKNDTLADFILDNVIINDEAKNKSMISKIEFHEKYIIEHGSIGIKLLGTMMLHKGYKETKYRIKIGLKEKQIRVWRNLTWNEEAECLIDTIEI